MTFFTFAQASQAGNQAGMLPCSLPPVCFVQWWCCCHSLSWHGLQVRVSFMIHVQGPIGIINFTALLPYSGKFSLVQIFAERKRDALTTPLQMMATPHMHVHQRPNDEVKQACATTAYSLVWRPSQLRKYQDCMAAWAKTGLLNRRIQHCWSRTQLRSVSYGFVGILYGRVYWHQLPVAIRATHRAKNDISCYKILGGYMHDGRSVLQMSSQQDMVHFPIHFH